MNKIRIHQASKSILEELNQAVPFKKKEQVIESRGHHIISSAINFLNALTENLDPEEADLITRRFLSSIKSGDPNRFVRQVRKLEESKQNKENDQ